MNLLKNYDLEIGEKADSPFLNKVGVYQDGTVPFCRDKKGTLWAISGHSHMGSIAMFKGTSLSDMQKEYSISTEFEVGAAGKAFNCVKYPEGVLPRGSMWPFGLYICPVTGRFFCLFHNETGWNGQGTAYDALGLCETLHFDSDFRHVGLMHSDDEGRTWKFDRWVLTAEDVCFTEKYKPEGINVQGQKDNIVSLGSGDFCLFIEPDGEYMYLFYDIIKVDVEKGKWTECNLYVARSRKRSDGVFGDFVKYYNGSFCEAGNLGKETKIAENAWHGRVAYLKREDCFLMTSSPANFDGKSPLIADYAEFRTSKDMLNWSEPLSFNKDGKRFGNHYQAAVSYRGTRNPLIIENDKFTFLSGHNGTDVAAYEIILKQKK